MIFQTLDDKDECIASYFDGGLHFDKIPENGSSTWNYHSYIPDEVEFAELYCAGKKISDVCPDNLKEEWNKTLNQFKAILKSFGHINLSTDSFCFYELVPRKFLLKHCEVKNRITDHILKNHDKPQNYDHLLKVQKLLTELGKIELKLNHSNIRKCLVNPKCVDFCHRVKTRRSVLYNQFGTRTGRLTTTEKSFPILTFPKLFRGVVEPYNHILMEVDVVSAEVATLFYLNEQPIPKGDLHQWINEQCFGGKLDRDKSKQRFFSWLYDPRKQNKKLEAIFNRDTLFKKYYDGECVTNPFGRTMKVGEEKALNYLVQSTFNDLFLQNVIKLNELLQGTKSRVYFCVHDSVVLDFHKEDKPRIDEILKMLSQVDDYEFGLHLSMGKNYGDMRKVLCEA